MVKSGLLVALIAGNCLFISACNDTETSKDPVAEGKSANITLSDTANATILPMSEQNLTRLQYGVKAGEKYHYKLHQTTLIDQDSTHAETEITMYYTKTIKSVRSDGSMEMTVRFDSVRAQNKVPDFAGGTKSMKEVKYSSLDSANRKDKRFDQFNILIGEEVTMIVSAKGSIDEVSGLTPLVNKVLGAQKDSIPQTQKNQLIDQIKNEAYVRNLQPEYQIFPDSTIDSNHTWTKNSSIPLFGIFPTNNTVQYKVESVKEIGGRKALEIVMNVKSMVTNPTFKNGPATFKLNDHQIQTSGKSIIDQEKGYTIFKKMEVMTFADATATNTQSKQSQRSKQKNTQVTTIELIR
ncbi:MAG: DUF6263 family protein [Bacteroidota bacterium]